MQQRRNIWFQIVDWVLIIAAILWAIFPFYWAFINSIKKPIDTFVMTWIPFLQFEPTLEHWINELTIRETQKALFNSTAISVCAATLAVTLGTLAGYALARFQFRRIRNEDLTIWFLSQRVMPPVVVMIPFFILMNSVRLRDTVLGLVLINTTFTLPFAVVIMRQMFRDLPREMEEAALVDGCSYFDAFRRVALPLVLPGLISTWIICLAFSWNEFLMALSLTSKDAVTMPVVILGAEHTRGVQFWYVGVRALLTMMVPTLLALAAQRYIVRGLTFGAVKG